MRVLRSEDRLVLLDRPILLWLMAFCLFAGGCVVLFGGLGGFRLRIQDGWVKPASLLVGAAVLWMSLRMPAWHPLIRTTCSRRDRTVIVDRWMLFGRTVDRYRFDAVRRFSVTADQDDDGETVWFAELVLRDGTRIPLATSRMRGERECSMLVAQANMFLSAR